MQTSRIVFVMDGKITSLRDGDILAIRLEDGAVSFSRNGHPLCSLVNGRIGDDKFIAQEDTVLSMLNHFGISWHFLEKNEYTKLYTLSVM